MGMENTIMGNKSWEAFVQCGSYFSDQTDMATRRIDIIEAFTTLNRNEDGSQCHSFDEILEYVKEHLGGVACILMNMGWVNEDGDWDRQQTEADIMSLPAYVASGITREKVKACTKRNEEEYKSMYMGWWNDCKQTYSHEERRTMKQIGKNVSRFSVS